MKLGWRKGPNIKVEKRRSEITTLGGLIEDNRILVVSVRKVGHRKESPKNSIPITRESGPGGARMRNGKKGERQPIGRNLKERGEGDGR